VRIGLNRAAWFSIVLGLAAFLLDRGHKFIQIEHLGWRGGEFIRVTGFFDYVLVWNTGISYGFLTGLPVGGLIAMMVVASALLVFWWWREDAFLTKVGLAICLGGAVSHIIDRIIYGAVPDFFHFHWSDWSFYVFNLSDTAITLGVVLLVIDLIWPRKLVKETD
jgi:signal peptidase II